MKRLGLSCLLLATLFNPSIVFCARERPSRAPYIERLQRRVEQWQGEAPALDAAANLAATRLMAGGTIYFGGTQTSFIWEAVGRSGGMMAVKAYSDQELKPDDILVAASATPEMAGLNALLDKARAAKCLIVLFINNPAPELIADASLHLLPHRSFGPPPPLGTSNADIDSLSNVAGMWAWTGQLIAACVARGKMPCMWESYGMPGSHERDAALQNQVFHTASYVTPKDAANLGRRYLTELARSLDILWRVNRAGFAKAAGLMKKSHAGAHLVQVSYLSHMFPGEMLRPPTPLWIVDASPTVPAGVDDSVLMLGYQSFPWDMTAKRQGPCIVTSSRAGPRDWIENPLHVYLNPCWEIQDALVELPGYDVNVLPASGVLQSSIYWQLVELAQ